MIQLGTIIQGGAREDLAPVNERRERDSARDFVAAGGSASQGIYCQGLQLAESRVWQSLKVKGSLRGSLRHEI